jgi:hypothetical protein
MTRVRGSAILRWVALLMVLAGAAQAGLVVIDLRSMQLVEGRVVGEVTITDDQGRPHRHPRIAFTEPSGVRHQIVGGMAFPGLGWSLGDTLDVYLDPGGQRLPRHGGFLQLWLVPTLFVAVGLVLAASIVGRALIRRARQNRGDRA